MENKKLFIVVEQEDEEEKMYHDSNVKGVFKNKEDAGRLVKKLSDEYLSMMKNNVDEEEIEVDEFEYDNLFGIELCVEDLGWSYRVEVVEEEIK